MDDEEHGAGKAILQMMQTSEIRNKAIFVVRMCGRVKLEENRLKCYEDAVKVLLEEHPFNKILQVDQQVKPKTHHRKPYQNQPGGEDNEPKPEKTFYAVKLPKKTSSRGEASARGRKKPSTKYGGKTYSEMAAAGGEERI